MRITPAWPKRDSRGATKAATPTAAITKATTPSAGDIINGLPCRTIVPLVLHDDLIGFVQLQKPVAPIALDWEVRDILKTAGRQVAGYLAVQETVEKLVQARQFDSFNRMSAFVVHDLKNLVAQLSLLLKNAARHRDNPEFQQDMLETIENVSDRMHALLLQLRVGAKPIEQAAPVSLTHALQAAIASKKGHLIEPLLHIDPTAEGVEVVAHRDRLERVVGHLIQNALEATPPGPHHRAVKQGGIDKRRLPAQRLG
jgi:putative PEP-CTERM system histidine kinase